MMAGGEVMALKIEIDREDDGRWIAEIPDLPGVMAYGSSRAQAIARVKALALRVVAAKVEKDRSASEALTVSFARA